MVDLYALDVKNNYLVVSYSDGISEYIDEYIGMDEFEGWVKDTGRLVRTNGDNDFSIPFSEYMRNCMDWFEVKLFLEQRIANDAST